MFCFIVFRGFRILLLGSKAEAAIVERHAVGKLVNLWKAGSRTREEDLGTRILSCISWPIDPPPTRPYLLIVESATEFINR